MLRPRRFRPALGLVVVAVGLLLSVGPLDLAPGSPRAPPTPDSSRSLAALAGVRGPERAEALPPPPAGPVAGILNLTVVNPTNVSSGTFELPVQVDSSLYASIINANWSNALAYYGGNGTPIDLWIQDNATNRSTDTTVWLRLSGIPPEASASVLLVFGPKGDSYLGESGRDGEAPELSPVYAEYDNGWRVFDFYDNFTGPNLSSRWIVSGNWSYAVHDGFSVNATPGNGSFISSRATFSGSPEVDFLGTDSQGLASAYYSEGFGTSGCTACDTAL